MRRNRREDPKPLGKGQILELEPHDAWQALVILLMEKGRVMVPEDFFTQPRQGAIVVYRDEMAKSVTFRFVDADEEYELSEEFGDITIQWTAPKATFRPPSTRVAVTDKTPGRRYGGRRLRIAK